jgi:hypothetical protein
MKRITKKQQYINSLEFDIESLNEIVNGKKFASMYQGIIYTKHAASIDVKDCLKELEKIKSDSTYKPWKNL